MKLYHRKKKKTLFFRCILIHKHDIIPNVIPAFKIKFLMLWYTILDTFFPPRCVACGTQGLAFCTACREKIAPASNTAPQTTSLFNYRDIRLKKALWSFKYRGNRGLAKIFARLLYDYLLEAYSESRIFSGKPITLIPIPISKKRKNERGFNQSELLVREMSLIDSDMSFICLYDVLYRTREAPAQATIKNREERAANMKKVFAVAQSEKIKDAAIILIDDITTTGATFKEAREALLSAGAREVSCLALAH